MTDSMKQLPCGVGCVVGQVRTIVREAERGVFTFKGGLEGGEERTMSLVADQMILTFSHGFSQSELFGSAADCPDTR